MQPIPLVRPILHHTLTEVPGLNRGVHAAASNRNPCRSRPSLCTRCNDSRATKTATIDLRNLMSSTNLRSATITPNTGISCGRVRRPGGPARRVLRRRRDGSGRQLHAELDIALSCRRLPRHRELLAIRRALSQV